MNMNHLKTITYSQVIDICFYVETTYGVRYAVSCLTKRMLHQGFRYKQLKAVPAKADVDKQHEFIEKHIE